MAYGNSQRVEAAHMATNRWADEQNVRVPITQGLLLTQMKEMKF